MKKFFVNRRQWALPVVMLSSFLLLGCDGHGSGTPAEEPQTPVPPVWKEVKDTSPISLPTLNISNVSPVSGAAQTIQVSVADARTIKLIPEGDGCGAIQITQVTGTVLNQTDNVAKHGHCVLMADVTRIDGITTTYTNEFTVEPTTVPAQGLSFKNGTYVYRGAFTANPSNQSAVTQLEIPQSFINGGTGVLYATVTGSGVTPRAIITISGVPGYYAVTGVLEGTRLRVDMDVNATFMKDSATLPARTITLKPIAADGGLGQPSSAVAQFQRVGSGTLQASLSFDQNDDLDLHVVTPAGLDIYYGSRSFNGGSLDLDSNAGCNIDRVNNENIVWPSTSTPAPGKYAIKVDFYRSCTGNPVNYAVKVINCGKQTSYSGIFQPTQADMGGANSGGLIAEIDYVPCSGLSVAGQATYDNYQPTANGLSSTPQKMPIRLAKVEVRQTADDALLGSGDTDNNGNYNIDFTMAQPGAYYVKVIASQDNATVKQRVTNNKDEIYLIRSAQLDAAQTPTAKEVKLHAQRNSSFAEAFSIFNLGVNAFIEVKSRTGTLMPPLQWEWTNGVTPACGTSCYSEGNNKIFILSSVDDEDAFDVSVLGHEFGHFFMINYSAENSPGGEHSSGVRSNPSLAWSEGAATYFSQQLLRQSEYIDTNLNGSSGFNLENPVDTIPRGTDDDTATGKVSEAMVAAILWDLADNARDSLTVAGVKYTDTFNSADHNFSTLFKLKRVTFRSPGNPGLVDFLDQYICNNYASWEATAGDNFRGLVSMLNGFPYTPAEKSICP
jgi:hypothetical protein